MKLSDREIEAISNIPRNRRIRSFNLWVTPACILIALVVGSYSSYDVTTLTAMLAGFLFGEAAAYSSTRSDDKLIDLVQRYVNSDPEAIRQFATSGRTHGSAA